MLGDGGDVVLVRVIKANEIDGERLMPTLPSCLLRPRHVRRSAMIGNDRA